MNETFRLAQNFLDQFRRCCLRVHAQQRLGSRGSKQYPRFRPSAIIWRVKKEFNSIQPFFLGHPKVAKLRGSVRARALDGAELHVISDVKVASAVEVPAEFLLKPGH